MRETRFRAWIEKYSEMCCVLSIDFVNDCFYVLPTAELEGGSQVRIPGLDQMDEYTGLHDKNSKELWQGDIYTDPNWPRKPLVVEWVDDLYDDNGSNYSGWSVAFPEEGMNNSAYGPTKIGNIFENPERLEAK